MGLNPLEPTTQLTRMVVLPCPRRAYGFLKQSYRHAVDRFIWTQRVRLPGGVLLEDKERDVLRRLLPGMRQPVQAQIQALQAQIQALNQWLQLIADYEKTVGAGVLQPRALPANKRDLIIAGLLIGGGKASKPLLQQTVKSWTAEVQLPWFSDALHDLIKDGWVRRSEDGHLELTNFRKALKRIVSTPAYTIMVEKPEGDRLEALVGHLLLDYCREKKSFHIRRDFMEGARLDFGPLYGKIESLLPSVVTRLKATKQIATETGHDGISIGESQPVAYVSYEGGL